MKYVEENFEFKSMPEVFRIVKAFEVLYGKIEKIGLYGSFRTLSIDPSYDDNYISANYIDKVLKVTNKAFIVIIDKKKVKVVPEELAAREGWAIVLRNH